MTDEKIIEIEVTAQDLEQMRADGVIKNDLPEIGLKRYRPARHIIKDKNKVTLLLDAEVLKHFEKRAEKENAAPCQVQINDELRDVMERERAEEIREELRDKGKLAA